LYGLQLGQTVRINGSVYTVKAMIEFRQGSFWWKEYTLEQAFDGDIVWLSVERGEAIPVCLLFRPVDAAFLSGERVVYEGREYSLHESGLAEVRDFLGHTSARVGDVVEFAEYRDKTGLLLSREQWPDRTKYSAGAELPKGKIAGVSSAPGSRETCMPTLPLGQELRIHGETYVVASRVGYRQGAFTWVEYELRPPRGPNVWLSAERGGEDGNACLLSLHRSIPYTDVQWLERSALYFGVVYQYVEGGTANVIDFEGGDYDYNERFSFTSYRSGGSKILSCEIWEDEKEASIGEELTMPEVQLSRCAAPAEGFAPSKKKRRCFPAAILLFFLAALVFVFLIPTAPAIGARLASNSSFQHVTPVTLPNGKKAQVYATALSPNEACRAIIELDPKHVQYVTTAAGTESGDAGERLVQTSRETVMIYVSEDGKTLAQVSERDMGRGGSYAAYRPRNSARLLGLYHNSRRWFDAGKRRSVAEIQAFPMDTRNYDSLVASARQASVSARRSSGGGRSFGK
jgi:hypothetical protein